MAKLLKLSVDSVRVPDFWFDPETDVIYFGKRIDGELVRFSTKVKRPNVRKAKEVANFKLKNKLSQKSSVRMLLGPLFDQYIEASEIAARRGEINESTVVKRRQIVRKLRPFWESKRPEEITLESWKEYIDWYEGNYPGERLFDVLKYMRHFARHLQQRTINGRPILLSVPALKNPFAARERKARKRKKSRIFTLDEITCVLSASDADVTLLVLLMYTMAFRVDEACTLKWASLDLNEGYYNFGEDDNKAGHEGRQAIHDQVMQRLMYRERKGAYVFPQLRDTSKPIRPQMIDWKVIKAESGVTWAWSPHTFRHTCLTQLFSNPKNAQSIIMQAFRISYKVALEHYIHAGKEHLELLRNAVVVL